ncbi:hypothetical protein CY35_01G120000 [Sphagnum magellanicum]|nr:hypothetical protein CY35_01G120000 [Sphagnum magellanicum]
MTSMWSMVYFVGLIHLSVDLCDSRSSNQPWKVTIPGFLLRGRIVWGWILEIQWSLSSWNKLGSLQRQLQLCFPQDHFMKLAKLPIFCITEIPV